MSGGGSHSSLNPPGAIFDSAAEFGLTSDEILQAVKTTLARIPEDAKASYMDELSGALARRLLAKQRS